MQLLQRVRRLGPREHERAQRVPGVGGDRGGPGALAADVTERERPLLTHREHLVEVAPDLTSVAGRPEAGREPQPRHVGERRGPKTQRQLVGDPGLLGEQLTQPAVQPRALGDVAEHDQPACRRTATTRQRHVGDLVRAFAEQHLGATGGEHLRGQQVCGAPAEQPRALAAQHGEAGRVDVAQVAEGVEHEHGVGHLLHDQLAGERLEAQEPLLEQPPGQDQAGHREHHRGEVHPTERPDREDEQQVGDPRQDDGHHQRPGLQPVRPGPLQQRGDEQARRGQQ